MKTFVAAMIAFCVMVSGFFIYLNVIGKKTEKMIDEIDEILNCVTNESWAEAEEKIEETICLWKENGRLFAFFLNKIKTDGINENFYALKAYIKNKNKTEATAKLEVIKFQIMQIDMGEKLKIENIF